MLGCVIASVCIILNKESEGRGEERSAFFSPHSNRMGGGAQDGQIFNII